ncbi:MAG: hypothetical protein PHS57_04455 [Alphaproteobacteria bacterium]|nr:hypothetical protein [Alphaproteobacteria bacterium]
MKSVPLPKVGCVAVIDDLDEADIFDVINLHEQARAALPENRKRHILPQQASYFKDLLAGTTGRMVGIRVERKLIAQLVLIGPLSLREAIAGNIITHNDLSFHHASLNDSVIVFKSMASLPDWRGNDLAQSLVDYAENHPFVRVADHLFTQISVSNRRSWNVFAVKKFGIVGAAYDPDDGLPRFVFQKSAFGFDLDPAPIVDDVDPTDDFDAIVSLTQREGLIGFYEEGQTQKLSFLHNREELNLMPVLARVSGRQ